MLEGGRVRIAARVLGLAAGVSEFHIADIVYRDCTRAHESRHEARAWHTGGTYRWRKGGSQDDGRTGTHRGRDPKEADTQGQGQIARRDDGRFTRRAHTETLIASREHTHETDTLTHTTTADRNGDRVPKRSESVKGETAGT